LPYEFAENEFELEPQACSTRGSGPPRKRTRIGVLDPPIPPKRLPDRIPAVPSSLIFRIIAGLLLAGLAAAILFLLFTRH